MLSRKELERIWDISKHVRKNMPSTYENLMGIDRFAVLRLLDEPIQSTFHEILQMKVPAGTRCTCADCDGMLDSRGHCSYDCSVLGIHVLDDVAQCRNCDHYGFPCMSCHVVVFHKQLPMPLEDY